MSIVKTVKKAFEMTITKADKSIVNDTAKSTCNMWAKVRKTFAEDPTCTILITDLNGNPVHHLHLETMKTGKKWFRDYLKTNKKPEKAETGATVEETTPPATSSETTKTEAI